MVWEFPKTLEIPKQEFREIPYRLKVPICFFINGDVTFSPPILPINRGVMPLRNSRHVPPHGVATLVNSLQNRVNSVTLCVTLNANTGKIVLVTLCIQIEWLFYNAFWCETVTRK